MTSLLQSGSNFVLGVAGPLLKVGGVAVTPSTYSGWLPIGVEAIAGGFEVAWKNAASGQFTIWYTDNSGNFASNQGVFAANSAGLQSFENSFHQDLNNNGVTGASAPGPLAGAGQDGFVFKADADPAGQGSTDGFAELRSAAEPPASVSSGPVQPHLDLFAFVSGDPNAHDAHPPAAVLADLLSGHFIIH